MNENLINYLRVFVFYFIVFFLFCSNSYAETLLVFSNWNDQSCGVAEHSRHFSKTLTDLELQVVQLDVSESFKDENALIKTFYLVKKINPLLINIQYHPGLYYKINENINLFMKIIREECQILTVISFHSEYKSTEKELNEAAGFIYYFKSKFTNHANSIYIPLPAPIFDEDSTNKITVRNKYGFDSNDIIISTCGFANPQKRLPEILSQLTSFLKNNDRVKIQFLVSPHPSSSLTNDEINRIRDIISQKNLGQQVYLSGKFLETKEYLERLFLSDLGFSWCPEGPHDSSAIEKDFVSVKVPLVINDVGHNQLKTGEGVIRVQNNMNKFISKIIMLTQNDKERNFLKKEMKVNYSKLNYKTASITHLKYFHKLNDKKIVNESDIIN